MWVDTFNSTFTLLHATLHNFDCLHSVHLRFVIWQQRLCNWWIDITVVLLVMVQHWMMILRAVETSRLGRLSFVAPISEQQRSILLVSEDLTLVFTVRMPQSGKLPVLNLLTGQKSGFSPRRGNSLHRFTSNLAWPTGTWVRLAVQNFTSVGAGGGNAAPKYQNFHFLAKSRPQGRLPWPISKF